MAIYRVNTLHPAVECLVEVIEVVLSEAAAFVARVGCVVVSHTLVPAVVHAKGLGEVAINTIESVAEVLCTSVNVEIRVLAIYRGITLVGGDLHKTLLAVGTGGAGVAGGLLHSDRGEENDGDIVSRGGLFKGVEVASAGVVGVVRPVEDGVECLILHIADGEAGWAPASTGLDATVEPIDGTIGTARGGGIGCGG